MVEKDPHDKRIAFTKEDANIFTQYNCKTILEVFFGDGRNTLIFQKKGFLITGIDDGKQNHNDYAIKGLEKLKEKGIPASITNIFNAKLPFADETFDGVVSWHYINHNYKEKIIAVFKEMKRVLKNKGLFSIRITKMEDMKFKEIRKGMVINEVSKEEIKHGFKPEEMTLLGPQTFARTIPKEKGIPHYAFYKEELQQTLEEIGFKVIKIEGVLWNWHAWCEK